MSGNTVTGGGSTGMRINRTTFNGGGNNPAPGGDTTIGSMASRVNGTGLHMTNVLGGLAFGELSVYNDNGVGVFIRDAGVSQISNTSGTLDTTNGTALDIRPDFADLTFSALSSTNANGQGPSNAFGGGFFILGTHAIGGNMSNLLTVDNLNVEESNGNGLTSISTSGVFNFGPASIQNLTSNGGAINVTSSGSGITTLNFNSGLDIDIFDGGDPVGATPGSPAINLDAQFGNPIRFSVADTSGDESIVVTDSAGGLVRMNNVILGPNGVHFDLLTATGTASDAELTGDGALQLIDLGGTSTFSVDSYVIVDGANTVIGLEVEDSTPTFVFGNYNYQNLDANQSTPVILTGNNGPVTFNQVNLGDASNTIGQPFRIVNNNNPVNILGGVIVAQSTTTGIQLFNQQNSGSLLVENVDITTAVGDNLQVSGGGGTVTVTGGVFTHTGNSDVVDIQNTSATVSVGADLINNGAAGGGVTPFTVEIDNTSGDITFSGDFTNNSDGRLIAIGLESGDGPTAGNIQFTGTLLSETAGGEGIHINDLGINASVNIQALIDLNGTLTTNGITVINSLGLVTFNGGDVSGSALDGFNCSAGNVQMNNMSFGANGGDTVETQNCTLSGTGNSAAPLACNDLGGNTGTVDFGVSGTCP